MADVVKAVAVMLCALAAAACSPSTPADLRDAGPGIPASCADPNDFVHVRYTTSDGTTVDHCLAAGAGDLATSYELQGGLTCRQVRGTVRAYLPEDDDSVSFIGESDWVLTGTIPDRRLLRFFFRASEICLNGDSCSFADTDELGRNPRCMWRTHSTVRRVGDVIDVELVSPCELRPNALVADPGSRITLTTFRARVPWRTHTTTETGHNPGDRGSYCYDYMLDGGVR